MPTANTPAPAPLTARTKLDPTTPTVAALLDVVRPGYVAGMRQVALLEVAPDWHYTSRGRNVIAALVDLRTLAVDDITPELGVWTEFATPATGTALVLIDRHMGADGNVSIVVVENTIDHATVEISTDTLLQGDALLAQLMCSTSSTGRLALALAETCAADRLRRESELAPETLVALPSGKQASATPDRRVGQVWDGTYRVQVNGVVTYGWRREQLTVIESARTEAA